MDEDGVVEYVVVSEPTGRPAYGVRVVETLEEAREVVARLEDKS